MVGSCIVKGCGQRATKGTTLFSFPRTPSASEAWVNAIREFNNPRFVPTKWSRICAAHFNTSSVTDSVKRKNLKEGTIPTNFPKKMDNTPVFKAAISNSNILDKTKMIVKRLEPKADGSKPQYKCSVPHCGSATNKNPGMIFVKFPKYGTKRFEDWCQAVKLKLVNHDSSYICSTHFVPSDFGPNQLKEAAIPSLHLFDNRVLGNTKITLTKTSTIASNALPNEQHSNAKSTTSETENSPAKTETDLSSVQMDPETYRVIFADCHRLCRFCLKSKRFMKSYSLLALNQSELGDLFRKITSIPLELTDDYSKWVCQECEHHLRLCARVQNDFVRVDKLWKIYLKSLPAKESIISATLPFEEVNLNVPLNGSDDDDDDNIMDSTEKLNMCNDMVTEESMEFSESNVIKEKEHVIESATVNLPPLSETSDGNKEMVQVRQYSCKICCTKFTSATERRTHMAQHGFVCRICTDCFESPAALRQHQRMCKPIVRDQCHWCAAKMNSIHDFREHIIEHHPNAALPECDKCGAKWPHKKYLLHHWRHKHLLEKSFKCSFCDKAFVRKDHCQHHERIHTGEKPFMCDVCGLSFITETTMLRHIKAHQTDTIIKRHPKRQMPCERCDFRTRNIHQLYSHIRFAHRADGGKQLAQDVKARYCSKCCMLFDSLYSRNVHSAVHFPWKCDICPKHFKDTDAVQLHMLRMHRKQRKYICTECQAIYSSSSGLQRHLKKSHTKEKRYQCSVCSKAFFLNCDMITHKRTVHFDQRVLRKCDHCPKLFQSWIGLYNHQSLVHNSNNKYSCSVCSDTFLNVKQLAAHHVQCHGGT